MRRWRRWVRSSAISPRRRRRLHCSWTRTFRSSTGRCRARCRRSPTSCLTQKNRWSCHEHEARAWERGLGKLQRPMDSYDEDGRPYLAVHPALLDALTARDDRCMASLVMSVLDVQLMDVFRHRTQHAPRSMADATLQMAFGAFSAHNNLSLVMGWCSPDGH